MWISFAKQALLWYKLSFFYFQFYLFLKVEKYSKDIANYFLSLIFPRYFLNLGLHCKLVILDITRAKNISNSALYWYLLCSLKELTHLLQLLWWLLIRYGINGNLSVVNASVLVLILEHFNIQVLLVGTVNAYLLLQY